MPLVLIVMPDKIFEFWLGHVFFPFWWILKLHPLCSYVVRCNVKFGMYCSSQKPIWSFNVITAALRKNTMCRMLDFFWVINLPDFILIIYFIALLIRISANYYMNYIAHILPADVFGSELHQVLIVAHCYFCFMMSSYAEIHQWPLMRCKLHQLASWLFLCLSDSRTVQSIDLINIKCWLINVDSQTLSSYTGLTPALH